ncbi:PP2C family protein-serine/threonine phosphatase [Actinospongicola halichondriae]|uniref:PP2C family protein-serine/threonine phosphatase n=1 Tax=Actinospongicola halichondriae TaxID=3236844 RepID=UPI003D4B49FC
MPTDLRPTLIEAVRQFGRAVTGGSSGPSGVDLQLLARVAQASRTSMMLTDADLDAPGPRILWVNEAFERTTGYAAAEVLGENPRFLQGPATDRAVLDELRSLLERDQDFEGEAINYRADGTPFVMSWRISALRDETGAPTHYVATQDDVTELRLRPLVDREALLELQAGLSPEVPPRVGELEFGSAYRPADGQLVGGDWIDVVSTDDDQTLVVVGDVTGHGAAAVAAMGQMQWAIRANAAAGLTLRRMTGSLRTLAQAQSQYATIALVRFGEHGTFRYLIAGHPPPVVVGVDGTVRELESTAPLIGLGLGAEDRTVTDVLEPGETLVAFTDGLFERRGSSVLDGLDLLSTVIGEIGAAGVDPDAFALQLVARMVEWTTSEDDIAVVVVRRSGDASVVTDQ